MAQFAPFGGKEKTLFFIINVFCKSEARLFIFSSGLVVEAAPVQITFERQPKSGWRSYLRCCREKSFFPVKRDSEKRKRKNTLPITLLFLGFIFQLADRQA